VRNEALIIEPKYIIFDLISRIIVSIAIVAKKDLLAYSQANRASSDVTLIILQRCAIFKYPSSIRFEGRCDGFAILFHLPDQNRGVMMEQNP